MDERSEASGSFVVGLMTGVAFAFLVTEIVKCAAGG